MWKPAVNSSFISYGELLFFIIFVVSFMYFLFPKEKIEKLVVEYRGENIQLANIYLENIIRIKPDPNLKLLLAKRYFDLGDTEKAEKLLSELENTAISDRVLMVKYEMLKSVYFRDENQKDRKRIYLEIENLLKTVLEKTTDLQMMEQIYRESVSMAFHSLALESAKKISIYKDNSDIKWLKSVYRHAVELKDYETALEYAKKIKAVDTQNYNYWLKEEYNLAVFSGKTDVAVKNILILCDLEPQNSGKYRNDLIYLLNKVPDYEKIIKWYITTYPEKEDLLIDVLAELYMLRKQYFKALDIYTQVYNKSNDSRKKDEYYQKIIKLMLANQMFDTLKSFVKDNYGNHLADNELVKLSIKAALAAGDTDTAYTIAKQVKEFLR